VDPRNGRTAAGAGFRDGRRRAGGAALAAAAILAGCGGAGEDGGYRWDLPPGFPPPPVPADNPMNEAKVELGRRLFYDRRLSGNETQSCASCHEQARAFTDGRARAVGSTGESHRRSAMALVNVAYLPTLTWANPVLERLEEQALVPLFGESPVELGMAGREAELLARLGADARYRALFPAAFPGEDEPITVGNVAKALAAFQRTLLSGRSPYDRYATGEREALSPAARRGMELFFSERLECHHCHGGFNFTGAVVWEGKAPESLFANTGLYDVDGVGAYPAVDTGLFEVTLAPEDMGAFRAPTLRNVAVTAPYMHDGSIATLAEVIEDHYARGGRLVADGPDAGDGRNNPRKSGLVSGFTLTAEERDDLLAFLEALTDPEFLADPRFADPFAEASADR
jgi:cytochrome c peroxidase